MTIWGSQDQTKLNIWERFFWVGFTVTSHAKMQTEINKLTLSYGQEATQVCSSVRIQDGFLQSSILLVIHGSFQTYYPFGPAEQDEQQTLKIIILLEVVFDHFF